jgi:hypothetical protein
MFTPNYGAAVRSAHPRHAHQLAIWSHCMFDLRAPSVIFFA